jgi:hypothetical protein
MKKFFLTMLLAAFLVSCDLLLDLNDLLELDTSPLKEDEFYAVDFTKETFYKVSAERLYVGEKCVIWAEKKPKNSDAKVSEAKAKKIAAKYDNIIRPKIVDAFSMKDFTVEDEAFEDETFKDILDYANRLADKKNNRLTILLLDIKDGFKDPAKDPYVAGYFYSDNFYPRNEKHSNGCDMIFVDTYPGLKLAEEQTYATFAHELQHLINFATTTLKRRRAMDTWIDEGLSSQAEHIYYTANIAAGNTIDERIFDEYIKEHCRRFSEDKNGTIAKGNNFFVWGNHDEEKAAILDEYSTVYLFFRWLYLQAKAKGLQSNIFFNIETSKSSDHKVITDVANNINPNWTDWDKLLRSWLAANYYPENADYGYKDKYFYTGENKIKVKPITEKSIKLYPGEGVYSIINKSFRPSSTGTYIRYAGLSSSKSSDIVTQTTFNPNDSNVLLTYNANTNNSKSTASETGYLTGVSSSVSSPGSRMVTEDTQAETPAGPYVIDARDYDSGGILGRNK